MNKKQILFCCIGCVIIKYTAITYCHEHYEDTDTYATTFVPRSAADNLAMSNHFYFATLSTDNCCNDACAFVDVNTRYTFQRSLHGKRIAEGLLGNHTLSFSGRDIKRDGDQSTTVHSDLFADYFGLSSSTKSATISFDPRLQSHIVCFNTHIGFAQNLAGAYLHITAPFIHTKWDLRASHMQDKGTQKTLSKIPFAAGYMDDVFILPVYRSPYANYLAPLTDFTDALNGIGFGKIAPWKYGKFFNKNKSASGVSGINLDLGYNVIDCLDYGVGAYLHIAVPGSNRKNIAEFVFTPVTGDAQWKLGAGLTARAELYDICDGEHRITGFIQGYLAHPFRTTQKRLFDFKNKGHLSRYMLLKEFNNQGYATGNIISGVNFSTRDARIKIDLQGEFLAQLQYKYLDTFGAVVGYNLYGKSHEKIKLLKDRQVSPSLHYGFKGDSDVQMAIFHISGSTPTDHYTADGAEHVAYVTSSQSNATISDVTMYTFQGGGSVDNYQPAGTSNLVGYGSLLEDTITTRAAEHPFPHHGMLLIVDPATNNLYVENLSLQAPPIEGIIARTLFGVPAPIYVTDEMIDVRSAAASHQITHKFFGAVDYTFDCCCLQPYIKLGGEVEIATRHQKQALNQWGIYVTGGVGF